MSRIKITVRDYSHTMMFVLPEASEEEADRVAVLLARAQQVTLKYLADGNTGREPVLVGGVQNMQVEIMDSDAFMTAKQYAEAEAAARAEVAEKAAKAAEKARLAAEAMPADELATV